MNPLTPYEEYRAECAARGDGEPVAGLLIATLTVATVVLAVWGGVAAFTTGAVLNGPTITAVVLCLATLRAMWGAARTTRSNP